jgi:GNAT superfamily N-acetyltransferase
MDETEELIRLSARALVAQMADVPGAELHLAGNCALGLTGEPLADFNILTVGINPHAEALLTQWVARVKARGLPLLVVMGPHVAPTLAPVATALGLTPAGAAPLMVLRAGTAVRPDPAVRVTRALGAELVAIAGDLAAAAFDLPRDVVARCLDVVMTETSGVETYIAWRGDEPMSAVSVTPAGTTAAISAMATRPAHQGKGLGRTLLAQVIDDYRGRGVQRFYLTATEAGRPLYASMGFETIAEVSAWILAMPNQASG